MTSLLALLLGALVSTAASKQSLTVAEVWARHHELDGQIIRVQGVVTRCEHLGCPLQQSATIKSKWLGVGTSRTFDRAIKPYLGKRIIVEGRLRADCLHVYADPENEITRPDGELTVVLCTDRSSMIMDPKLIGRAK